MRRKVSISTLNVGECFVLDRGHDEEIDSPVGSMLQAELAYRLVSLDESEARVVSACGSEAVLSPDDDVTQIPRMGFDRLAHNHRRALEKQGTES